MGIFPNGARVCFIGDSITHNNGHVAYVMDHYLQKHPRQKVKFFNCGISGATVQQHIELLEQDALSFAPTHAVIMLGVNDSKRTLLEKPRDAERDGRLISAFEAYRKNIATLCGALQKRDVEIILCTPAPYDEFSMSSAPALHGGSALLAGYAEFIRAFGQENGIAVCDYHGYLTRVLQNELIYNEDRVHLTERGQYHMAKCFLKFQGEAAEDFYPLPQYLDEWREKVRCLRDIYAAEYIILHSFTLSPAEGREKVRQYLDTTPETPAILEYYAHQYLTYKSRQEELKNGIFRLSDALTNNE